MNNEKIRTNNYVVIRILEEFENVVNSLGWDAIGGKENNDLHEWYIWLKDMVLEVDF